MTPYISSKFKNYNGNTICVASHGASSLFKKVTLSVCSHPEILLPYQRQDVTREISLLSRFLIKGPKRGTLGATQYRKENWQIPKYRVENRRNTNTAFMIGPFVSISRVFISSMYTPEIRRSLELNGTTIQKPGHWMS